MGYHLSVCCFGIHNLNVINLNIKCFFSCMTFHQPLRFIRTTQQKLTLPIICSWYLNQIPLFIRKDMGLNKNETLSSITHIHKLKKQNRAFISVLHSSQNLAFNKVVRIINQIVIDHCCYCCSTFQSGVQQDCRLVNQPYIATHHSTRLCKG